MFAGKSLRVYTGEARLSGWVSVQDSNPQKRFLGSMEYPNRREPPKCRCIFVDVAVTAPVVALLAGPSLAARRCQKQTAQKQQPNAACMNHQMRPCAITKQIA